ncbi:hypothetical protein LINPERHAP1_LOCUS22206 [Linum perenne]
MMRCSVKVKDKLEVTEMNLIRYNGKPRLGMERQHCDGSEREKVIRGGEQRWQDDEIYDGAMHSLLFGEMDENIEIVRRDILNWLSDRR